MAFASEESRVLLLYTGGTIGMLSSDAGYTPEPFFLFETLRSQTSRFHDPLGDSLLSKGRSVEGFRAWSENQSRDQSRSRATSPQRGGRAPLSPSESSLNPPRGLQRRDPSITSGRTPVIHEVLKEHSRQALSDTESVDAPHSPLEISSTLPVRSTRPVQVPPPLGDDEEDGGRGRSMNKCKKIRDNCYEAALPSLVTPVLSTAPGGNVKRIRYAVLEWNPLLDSSNMEIADWIRIAEEIELNYHLFDAFVVLHGTDTMCYSSSALSFLLEDLGKTVILTGAQIPLSQLRNDAVENLLGALSIAGQYLIPECCLFFNHTLYRGNRVSKVSSSDFDAFDSPNFLPLAKVGIDIEINWADVVRPISQRAFKAHKQMCPNVATLRLFPGITAATVKAFLAPPVQGVVLETFGAGNAPQRADLMDAMKAACERGVIIVAISQCAKGSVSDAYETGRTLQAAGVASGGDMTTECALAKLAYLLSKPERLSTSQVHALMSIPLRGELTLRTSHAVQASSSFSVANDSARTPESFGNLLNHITRLSAPQSLVPSVRIAPPRNAEERPKPAHSLTLLGATVALSKSAREAASSWSNTASETATAEAALYPFLVHLAVAKDDVETLKFCLGISETKITSPVIDPQTPMEEMGVTESFPISSSNRNLVKGGIANCLDIASGRTPLHVAALNGSVKCAQVLLEAGALVHIRDSLDHTALYYAARHSHGSIVDSLLQAGAHLGGADVEGGYVRLAIKHAQSVGDQTALLVWRKVGF